MVEAKANFVACTAKRRVMIKKICLEEIVGFSFFDTNIKIQELISASVKVKSQEKIYEKFNNQYYTINFTWSNKYEIHEC